MKNHHYIRYGLRIFLWLALLAVIQISQAKADSKESNQQNKNITGIVVDESGESIIGASVTLKGTSNGTVTGMNGEYTLPDVPANAILIITYLGMKTEEISVNGQSIINVILKEDAIQVDEVVVVGYGVQKKANLTGAVSAVKMDVQLSSRSLGNVSLALQGKIPGLAVSQNSGMAGQKDVKMLVRGMGTVNNADPLVVIDGMPDININLLNMDDIESISVLKDASSSAVYGSRAANGVILITTKTGKDVEPKINASASYTLGKPVHAWEFMSDYAQSLTLLQQDAAANTLPENFRYKNGTIDQWLALGMIDPLKYPNTDWYDVVLRDSEIQKYNVSASGGNKNSNYYLSIGAINEKGLLMNNDYTQYNGRLNYNAKIKDNITVGAKFAGNWSEMQYASDSESGGSINANQMRYAVAGITPYDPVTGYYGGAMAYGEDSQIFNPYSVYTNQLTKKRREEANVNAFFDWTLLKGLVARMDFGINYYNDFRYQADIPNQAYNFQTGLFTSRRFVEENAPIYNYTNSGYKTQLTGQLNYGITFAENHDLKALFVYTREYWNKRYQMSGANDRLHPSLHEIDAALTAKLYAGGNSNAESLVSYIGRLNYIAYQKYLFEVNLRTDASSRFIGKYRRGYFPSASLGWIFSEESFLNSFLNAWLSQGKFRASYGTLGNNSGVGVYEQQETLKGSHYIVDGNIAKGFVNTKMINQDLSWEETSVANIGLDLGFLRNRFSVEIDYYDRLTTGMNRPSDFSILLEGAYSPPPRKNIGNLRNRGIEGNLTWRGKNREFSYTINVNASYNATTLEKWNEYLGKGMTSEGAYVFIGMPYNYVYAYEVIGIAQTWNDVYKAAPQGGRPGDLLYKDLNGDGKISAEDQRAYPNIQRDRPTSNFALNSAFEWKGFDLAIMLQGAAGRKTFWLTANNSSDLSDSRQAIAVNIRDNTWSPENRNAEFTRLGGANNRKESTFYLDNLAYLRVKNVQLGYNIPKPLLKKIGLSGVRAFFSTDNLLTFTKFRGLDPEKLNVNDGYPMMKSFTIGLNIEI
jgi:TonB-linked SusC/RagA family outer membrane protein